LARADLSGLAHRRRSSGLGQVADVLVGELTVGRLNGRQPLVLARLHGGLLGLRSLMGLELGNRRVTGLLSRSLLRIQNVDPGLQLGDGGREGRLLRALGRELLLQLLLDRAE